MLPKTFITKPRGLSKDPVADTRSVQDRTEHIKLKDQLHEVHRTQVVDAAAALINGEVTPALVNAKFSVSRTTAERYSKAVQQRYPDLPRDCAESLQVKRATIRTVYGSDANYPDRMPYTDHERR